MFKLNKKYDPETFVLEQAKTNNLTVIINYSWYSAGEVYQVETFEFIEYHSIDRLCERMANECIDALNRNHEKKFEIPDHFTNDEITVDLDIHRRVSIYNIPKDTINIEDYDEYMYKKISSLIKSYFDEK